MSGRDRRLGLDDTRRAAKSRPHHTAPSLDRGLPARSDASALVRSGLEQRKRPPEEVAPAAPEPKKAKRVRQPDSPGLLAIKEAMANAQFSTRKSKDKAFDELVAALRGRDDFVGFRYEVSGSVSGADGGGSGPRWLEISRDAFDVVAPKSTVPWRAARVLLSTAGSIAFVALGRTLSFADSLPTDEWQTQLADAVSKLEFDWSFCCGVTVESANIDNQHLQLDSVPFHTWRSAKCATWLKKKYLRQDRCAECSLGFRKYQKSVKQREERDSEAQTAAHSRTKLSTLSPNSLLQRARNVAAKSKASARRARAVGARMEALDLDVSPDQSGQLAAATDLIATNFSADLNAVLGETAAKCDGDFAESCRSAWLLDQGRNRPSGRGNRWSAISIRLALAVFARSPAAYEQLKQFPVFQLPSVRQLQRKVSSAYSCDQGISIKYLLEQSRLYSEQAASGKFGKQTGVLIFDETKIVGKLCWNSKSHKLFGVATSAADLTSLADVYRSVQGEEGAEPAEYALQFVWRALTCSFDLLGPYWFSAKTMSAATLFTHVHSAMRSLESAGFEILALVCDGAAYNLSLLKMLTCRHLGPFGVGQVGSPEDAFRVPCQFDNPFRPGNPVFTIICPTHLLKNCINALHSSRFNGSKLLRLRGGGQHFGWRVIEDLWSRETERRPSRSQLVPKLLHSYIVRDPWTKLNVRPAKIMQKEEVISELKYHLKSKPKDSKSVSQAVEYLEACNSLFERGFLSHEKAVGLDSAPARHINQGYRFFRNWHKRLQRDCADFAPSNPREKRFLAWQTWDLLRLSIFGFLDLVEHFHSKYPDNYLIPHASTARRSRPSFRKLASACPVRSARSTTPPV